MIYPAPSPPLTTSKITSRDSLQNCCDSTTCFNDWVCQGPAKLSVENFGYDLGGRGYLLTSCNFLGIMQDELFSASFVLPWAFILLKVPSTEQDKARWGTRGVHPNQTKPSNVLGSMIFYVQIWTTNPRTCTTETKLGQFTFRDMTWSTN